MLERRRALGLAQEALAKALVGRVFGCEQLEGNVALQSRVVGAVDDTHPTAAEDGLEPVPQQVGAEPWVTGDLHGFVAYVSNWRPPSDCPLGRIAGVGNAVVTTAPATRRGTRAAASP